MPLLACVVVYKYSFLMTKELRHLWMALPSLLFWFSSLTLPLSSMTILFYTFTSMTLVSFIDLTFILNDIVQQILLQDIKIQGLHSNII